MTPRDHPGGPWEHQDGHEFANNRIVVDFEVIFGICLCFIFMLVSRSFFYRFLIRIFDLGLQKRCFRTECIAKIDFSWKSFYKNPGIDSSCLLDALGAVFLNFQASQTNLKTKRFYDKQNLTFWIWWGRFGSTWAF